ncbi:uncharacterized protein VNE69_05176 [Vairimorpha necatrix]|uniref:Uncharacterized protein n=1 Tax=Vairimorpha necatrix TaxID=6039 RepID=A0AAX4JCI3_9MICR
MNSSKLIIFFVFIHSWKGVYDRLNTILTNKIAKRDYCVIVNNKRYLKVEFKFLSIHELNAKLEIEFFPWNESKSLEDININCRGKSVETIVKEFEEVLLLEYEKILADSIILVYNSNFYVVDPIYKKIINYLKEENAKRTELSMCSKIFYDIIDDHYCLWDRIVGRIKIDFRFYNGDPKDFRIPLTIVERNDECYLNISIYLDDVYYFFELNLKELKEETFFNRVELKSSDTNETNKVISKKFHDLYRFIILEGLSLNYKKHIISFDIDNIELYNLNFVISINNNSIQITHNLGKFVYNLDNNSTKVDNENIIEKKTLEEFKELFIKIRLIDFKYDSVELFFRLIENKNKIELLLDRIISNSKNPLCIICAHLMLIQKLIDRNEFNKMLGVDKLNGERKIQIIEIILRNLILRVDILFTYFIKICLFLEAERYINENDDLNDSIFNTLKQIGILVKLKENIEKKVSINEVQLPHNKNIIDIVKIYRNFEKLHFKDIKILRKQILIRILEISILFTGLEKTKCEINSYQSITHKDTVINTLGFDINEVNINNEAIRKKLASNSQEDAEKKYRKYFYQIKCSLENNSEKNISKEELKYNFEKILKLKLSVALNEIMTDALNIKVDHLYDQEVKFEFLNKLLERIKIAIKNLYEHDSMIIDLVIMINNRDENIINELYNEIVEKIGIKLLTNIEKNVRICCRRELLQVLKIAFESFFTTELNIKFKYEKYINQIIKVLSEEEILEFFAEVKDNFHDDLVKIYVNQDDKIFN